jgi:hypothetical protein
MKIFLCGTIAVLGILTAVPIASQAQSFTVTLGDESGYYAPTYYGYRSYIDDYYNPGYDYYYERRVYIPDSCYRGYYYRPRYRYHRWRHHDVHEWNHD